MATPRSHALPVSLLLAILPFVLPPAYAQGADHFYYFFHERRPLALDLGRIAVQRARGARLEAALSPLGVAPDAIQDLRLGGWSLVATPPQVRTNEGVTELVERLALDPAASFVSPVFVGREGGPVIVTSQILAGFTDAVAPPRAEALIRRSRAGRILERDWAGLHGAYRLRSSAHSGFAVLAAANALARRPGVRFAEPDMIFTSRSALTPNDPEFGNLWGIHNTGAGGGVADMDMDGPEAWDLTTGDAAVLVTVLDDGVQRDHPDIHQVPGFDATSDGGNGGPVNACDRHGTAVAGCVSAVIDNGIGVVGIAPGTRVASARNGISTSPCDGSGITQSSWTVDSLAWAESIGSRITNNSHSYGFSSSAIAQKYLDTHAAGMVHFASAGNQASSSIAYPANLPGVNAVAALRSNGARAGFSNYGVGLAFSAPGEQIETTDRTGSAGYSSSDYVLLSGTSFASPYAAGVAALVLSAHPELTAQQVEAVLQQSAVDLGASGYDTDFGWGFVNARAALDAAGGGPGLRIGNPTTTEGDAGTTPAVFEITLSSESSSAVTVDYATSAGSARAGSDYSAATGALTFLPGTTSQTLAVLIAGDTLNEADERFRVRLSNAQGARIEVAQGIGTIVNDDPLPAVSVGDATAFEGEHAVFTISLSEPSGRAVAVEYRSMGGSALPGRDYRWAWDTVVFPAGSTLQTIAVELLPDGVAEPDETFLLKLVATSAARLGHATGVGTIRDR